MQIDSMSVLRGKLVHPLLDERPGVVRAGAGFGMELKRTRAQLRELEALDRAVVERYVRRLRRLARFDGKAVVLARDKDATGSSFQHRMVRAAMAERELVRLVAGRLGDQLVAEADAH